MPRWIVIAALALLLGALLVVVVLLPRLVAERDTAPGSPAPGAESVAEPAAAPPAADPEAEARARRAAERALDGVLARQSVLESENVAVWGGADYDAVLDDIAAGDAALGDSRYAEAAAHYAEAQAGLTALAAGRPARLERLLAEGAAALAAGDGEAARRVFAMALALAPADDRAARGLERARVVEEVAAALADGAAREKAGDLEGAQSAYRAALDLDPGSMPAREALARVDGAIAERDFRNAMSAALDAMERGDLAAAGKFLAAARALAPGSPRVGDLATRLETAVQGRRIETHRKRARALEAEERWGEAQTEYAAALAIDSRAAFARDGIERSRERARLHAELDGFLRAPERLRDAEPRAQALSLLAAARAAGGEAEPRLAGKTAALEEAIERARAPVGVELRSDGQTEVVVYRVGRLGKFERRSLSLPPGEYVAVGTRAGYRDVRVEFTLEPGVAGASVLVRCEERI